MKKLICVYCGKQYIISKFTRRTCYDYECPDCFSKRKKKSLRQNTESSALGNAPKLYHKTEGIVKI